MAPPAGKTSPVAPEPRGDVSKLLRTYDERKANPEPTIPHEVVIRLLRD